jgi:hypothetical protein
MNYGEYMRNKQKSLSKFIGMQNAQDASQVTLKNQALATTLTLTSFLSTNVGYTGVPFTGVPLTTQTSDPNSCQKVLNGLKNADARQNLIGYAQMTSLSQNIERRTTTLPCVMILSTITNAPSTNICTSDTSQIFRDNTELIANEGRNADLRSKYNLPNKLQGLRGPVMNSY